jgi:hypothetical protein
LYSCWGGPQEPSRFSGRAPLIARYQETVNRDLY